MHHEVCICVHVMCVCVCLYLYLRLLTLGPVLVIVLVSQFFESVYPVLLKDFKEAFIFDLVLFVYVFLVLCSKDVFLGLSVFQSMKSRRFWRWEQQ